ncbi:AfsR family transcriptional regulator [Saccharothrix sp. ALI-22-I]|uniref:BTAD domain-containing putative transcriptional regulator n=1 Tax=Saccharothrix sp. ALI-22-I TaxID=1933778 RepID=UPI00097CA396|nr:BTAD domain-containing putative transcriptional regulator [Saccharothrix sp. ALI-22-I]ONI92546.1 AfsR family transcriptional regulator [Saccharothrix sp. ALI-22-I]
MRFGVLGSLEVWTSAGRPVWVPEVKVRALLADLLANEGRPVSADRLIGDLWGAKLPANPAGSLHTKVSQLRRALETAEPGGRDCVLSTPAGYLVRAEPGGVDAERFAELVGRARATDDPRSRGALLGDALALWRGPAFADFADEPFARDVRARLQEEWLVAQEEVAENRLELGEHSLLIGKLNELVARYPLRERLRAIQLRALYLAGRTNEALDSFTELRTTLAESLGVDPSPQLVVLQRAILNQDPGLAATLPPATVATWPRTNLPAAMTTLIGREEAVGTVRRLLETSRLVTLTGSGGVGKTRLALATAHQVVETFRDGVWLVELAALGPGSTVDALAEVVVAVLGIREDAAASGALLSGRATSPVTPLDRLTDAVRGQQALLVLDNCEHVVDSVAVLVETLLAASPGLRVLATGQGPIGVDGDTSWAVPPLDLPDPEDARPEALRRSSAVRLFLARVPGFALDEGNSRAVAAICRRLDGIPLALELAATKVRVLGVHQLLARLDDRFRLLAGGYRGAPPRQQTLRAMIDWSWELLGDAERVVLCRLAVHAEGCTLEAAEAVCAGGGVAAADVLELVARLVDRSLVVMAEGAYGPRYRLLESVAEYCLGRLAEAGDLDALRLRHLRYYVDLVERAEPKLRGPDQRQWLERLDLEAANVRRAIGAAVARGAAGPVLRLVNAMSWYWFLRGRLTEGHRELCTALEVVDGAERSADTRGVDWAAAHAWHAGMALLVGERAPMERSRQATGVESVADVGRLARAEWFFGFAQWYVGALTASGKRIDQVLTTFRSLRDRWGVAAALSTRAALGTARGDLATLRSSGEESAALFRELGDRWGRLKATETLGVLAEIEGDYERAERLHAEGLQIAEDLGLWTETTHKLAMLGRIALLKRDFATADALHARSMRLAAEQSNKLGEEFAEVGLALSARQQGRLDDAEAHLTRWLDWLRELKSDNGLALVLAELGFIAESRGDAERARSLHLDGLTAARATGDQRAVALALEGLAGVQALDGLHHQAARLLGAATAARESAGAPLPPAERGDVDRIAGAVRAALGDDGFDEKFSRGRELDRPDDEARARPEP